MRLYSRSDYGVSRFNYQFFNTKRIDDFNRLILGDSGNDWGLTMFRDGAMQSLIHQLGLDTQHYRHTVLFINGEYWGIHNLRDRLDKHYLETHYTDWIGSIIPFLKDKAVITKV
nr:CotH kinase family protein [Evansella tamaricis]